ncbi:intermembrane lipid transfer protein VPS13C-like [Sycon ciliatum]|uniref:intermembrane lipid transfer protein VPS13C-like n=1 Tax=Sycon ciliatum TaxID=27933 RepID=UPI0031F70E06
MVFESLVAELLNKHLGSFVQSLDASQLNLGILGGTVELDNLAVREEALLELGLPVLVKSGHLRKLRLKIPWSNLYSDPVEVKIDGVYVLAQPTHATPYDAEKDLESKRDKKRKELLAIEEAQKKAAEKGDEKKKKEEDGFAVKLAMQIIRNVQVSITDIHIRYEDTITVPGKLLAYGVTLERLTVQTTNAEWKPMFMKQESSKFWKLVELSCLSVYCDVNAPSLLKLTPQEWQKQFAALIPRELDDVHPRHEYLVNPISATAKLAIDKNAPQDPTSPQIDVSMSISQVSLGVSRQQFQGTLMVVEHFDQMVTNLPYRKYKPNVPLKNNARAWWTYALDSTLKEDVQPRLRQWSWERIRNHRALVRRYEQQWKVRLSQKNPTKDLETSLQNLSDQLDVFNLTLARQNAAAEYKRETGKKAKKSGGGGWFGGWLGGGSKQKEEAKPVKDAGFSEEERAKLYSALNYVEGERPGDFPPSYVARRFKFSLGALSFALHGDNGENVTRLLTSQVDAALAQRPGANALSVQASIGSFLVSSDKSQLITSQLMAQEGKILELEFDQNPENSIADMRLKLQSKPLEIFADLESAFEVVRFFDRPEPLALTSVSAAANRKLQEIRQGLKEISKIEIYDALEKRKMIDLDVKVHAPYIVFPNQRDLHGSGSTVVVDLGSLHLTSDLQDSGPVTTEDLHSLSPEELDKKMYDTFSLELKQLQMIVTGPGEDWREVLKQPSHAAHLLLPLAMNLRLQKSLTDKSERLPVIKLSGEVPLLHVDASDYKLKQIVTIIESLPEPPSPQILKQPKDGVDAVDYFPVAIEDFSAAVAVHEDDLFESDDDEDYKSCSEGSVHSGSMTASVTSTSAVQRSLSSTRLDITKFHADFHVKKVALTVSQRESEGTDRARVELAITDLNATVSQRECDLAVDAKVGQLSVSDPTIASMDADGGSLCILHSDPGTDLITVKLVQAKSDGPDFAERFHSTATNIDMEMSSIHVTAHQQSLFNLMEFADSLKTLQPKLGGDDGGNETLDDGGSGSAATDEKSAAVSRQLTIASIEQSDEFIKLLLKAKLPSVRLQLASDRSVIAVAEIRGIESTVKMQYKYMNVAATLSELVVQDPQPGAIHQQIVGLARTGEKVLDLSFDKYDDATTGEKAFDMDSRDMAVKVTLGQLQFVFINAFLQRCLAFLKGLQLRQETLDQAAQAAATGAAASFEAVREQSGSRIRLDIDVAAPVVVVPLSSESDHSLVLWLGRLTVLNTFVRHGDITNSDGTSPVVIDDMAIALTDVKVARRVVKNGVVESTDGNLHTILQEVTMSVNVRRSLSPWCHDIADVAVAGECKPIQAQVCKGDVDFVFGLLDGNLKEGMPESGSTQPAAPAGGSVVPSKSRASSPDIPETPQTNVPPSKVKLELSFKLEEVSLTVLETLGDVERPRLRVAVSGLSAGVTMRQYDLQANAAMNYISVEECTQTGIDGGPMYILDSDRFQDLLVINVTVAQPEGPEFASKFSSTKTKLDIVVCSLRANAHLQTLLGVQQFVMSLLPETLPESTSGTSIAVPAPKSGEDTGSEKPAVEAPAQADVTDLSLTANLVAFSVMVSSGSSQLAQLSVGGVSAQVEMSPAQLMAEARLKSLEVVDLFEKTSYRKIVSAPENEDLLHVKFVQYKYLETADYSLDPEKLDMELFARMGQVEVVFLNRFVQGMLVFVKEFQTSQETINAAKARASEAAAAGAEALQQNAAKKVKLDVTLRSPVVTVPSESTGTSSIQANFGVLQVSNSLQLTEHLNNEGIMDRMVVSVTDLSVSRGTQLSSGKVIRRALLKPVDIKVDINRCLTPGDFGLPENDIVAKLPDVQVHIGQTDLGAVLKIVEGNLQEKPAIEPQTAAVPAVPPTSPAPSRGATPSPDKAKTEPAQPEPTQPANPDKVVLKASFSLQKVFVGLYQNEPDLVNEDCTDVVATDHSVDYLLASLDIQKLDAKVKMRAGGYLEAKATLGDIIVDDGRKQRQGSITRMVSKRSIDIGTLEQGSNTDDIDSMLAVTVEKHSTGDLLVIACLNGIQVIAYLDFILAVVDFAQSALSKLEDEEEDEEGDDEEDDGADDHDATGEAVVSRPSSRATSPSAEKPEQTEFVDSPMRISVHVNSVEALLVEDANDLNSRAIILRTSAAVLLNRNFGQTNISGNINTISVTTSHLKTQEVAIDILEPCSLDLNVSQSSEGSTVGSANLTALTINIDPCFVTLLMGVLKTLQERQAKLDEEKEKALAGRPAATTRHSIKKTLLVPRSLWTTKRVNRKRWYFLRGQALSEIGTDVDLQSAAAEEQDGTMQRRTEQFDVTIRTLDIVLLFEPDRQYDRTDSDSSRAAAGAGPLDAENKIMVPLLGLHTTVSASVCNWSGQLKGTIDISVQASYFNRKLALWEPLIEPIETVSYTYRPYKITAELTINKPDEDEEDEDDDDDDDQVNVDGLLRKKKRKIYKKGKKRAQQIVRRNRKPAADQLPLMALSLQSRDLLQMTLTKTGIQVLQVTAEVFGAAASVAKPEAGVDRVDGAGGKQQSKASSQYKIVNMLEVDVMMVPGSSFKAESDATATRITSAGGSASLSLTREESDRRRHQSVMSTSSVQTSKADINDVVAITVCGAQKDMPKFAAIDLPVHRCGRFYHVLPSAALYGIIVQIDLAGAQKVVTLRSPMQVHNHTEVSINIHCRVASNQPPCPVALLRPGEVVNVPLSLSAGQMQFAPSKDSHSPSEPPSSWKMEATHHRVECKGAEGSFGLRVRKEEEQVLFLGRGPSTKVPHHCLHLYPVMVFQNMLPYPLSYQLPRESKLHVLAPGARKAMYTAEKSAVTVPIQVENYFRGKLVGNVQLEERLKHSHVPLTMKAEGQLDTEQRSVEFSVEYNLVDTLEMAVYVDHWIVNQSDQIMKIRPYDSHPPFFAPDTSNDSRPILYGFKKKGKSKVEVYVGRSKASDGFSLATAGSEGRLLCEEGDAGHELGVKVVMSYFNLSNIVYFTPYNLICNYTQMNICAADTLGYTVELPPDAVKPFYPSTKANIVRVKPGGAEGYLKDVNFSKSGLTLLKVDNSNVLIVSVDVSNAVTVITIENYFSGAAPGRIENFCKDTTFTLQQKDDDAVTQLGPGSECLFVWNNPTGKRELVWSTTNEKGTYSLTEDLMENNRGEFDSPGGEEFNGRPGKIYWVSLIDGLQRVLLFTPNKYVADQAYESDLVERVNQDFSIELPGVGLSLVNNSTSTEILYMAITSSGAIWQVLRSKDKNGQEKWKTLTMSECLRVEKIHDGVAPDKERDGDFVVEWLGKELYMTKPHKGLLRRSFHQGVSLRLTHSDHQTKLHASINKVQIDNQLRDAGYPGVFYPMAPPKTVALQSAPKPFIEFSFMQNISEDGTAKQIKYMVLLIQAMHVKVDIGFVMAILNVFAKDMDPDRRTAQVKNTMEMLTGGLSETAAVQAVQKDTRTFYDYVHLSPLKMTISFSLHAADKVLVDSRDPHVELLVSLLHSIGVTLSEATDIQLKLAFFEVDSEVMTQGQLTKIIVNHYKTQGINQLYVFVLGLDVLGNPFGLVRGFKDGLVDLFYEPYQGAVQGPEEFAQGLLLGGRSFVGASVGGIFGAVGKIAGAVGGGIARLTLDQKFIEERRRRQGELKDAASGLVQGGKSLGWGLFDGITGIVRKPVEGALAEGAEGFFKGVGKGLIGVVARPVGGVIDFAGSTFEGIKKQIELADDKWVRLRARRFLLPDGAVTPFSSSLSFGNMILAAIVCSDDVPLPIGDFQFQQLVSNTKDSQYILLATSRYVILVELPYSFMNVEESVSPEWHCLLTDVDVTTKPPQAGPNFFEFTHKVKAVTIFSKSSETRKLKMPSKEAAQMTRQRLMALIQK